MPNDMEILKQIEHHIKKKLEPLPLDKIMDWRNTGISLDNDGRVVGLNLDRIRREPNHGPHAAGGVDESDNAGFTAQSNHRPHAAGRVDESGRALLK